MEKNCLDFLVDFCLLSEQLPMKLVETILQGWHEFGGADGVCLVLKGGGGSRTWRNYMIGIFHLRNLKIFTSWISKSMIEFFRITAIWNTVHIWCWLEFYTINIFTVYWGVGGCEHFCKQWENDLFFKPTSSIVR